MNEPLLRLGALEMGTAFVFGLVSFYAGIALFKRYMRIHDLWVRIVQQSNLALAILQAARQMDEMGKTDVITLSFPHVIAVAEPQPRTAPHETRAGPQPDAFAPITLLP